jgi:hypothetical protein
MIQNNAEIKIKIIELSVFHTGNSKKTINKTKLKFKILPATTEKSENSIFN